MSVHIIGLKYPTLLADGGCSNQTALKIFSVHNRDVCPNCLEIFAEKLTIFLPPFVSGSGLVLFSFLGFPFQS